MARCVRLEHCAGEATKASLVPLQGCRAQAGTASRAAGGGLLPSERLPHGSNRTVGATEVEESGTLTGVNRNMTCL